jgi:hypothetical protein
LKAALKINDDKHSTNFNITGGNIFDHQILISVTPPGVATKRGGRKLRARANPSATASASASASAGGAGTYDVTMTATWPCASESGVPKPLSLDPAPPDVATACTSNHISDTPDAWKAYGVDAYLTSIIAQETNSPGHPNLPIGGIPGGPIKSSDLNIGDVLTRDAAGPNECTISDSTSTYFT